MDTREQQFLENWLSSLMIKKTPKKQTFMSAEKYRQVQTVEQAQEKQAKKMVKDSQARLEPLQVGNNVVIPIPRIDCGRTAPANLLGIVLNVTAVFLHNQVEMCAQKLPQEENSVIVF